ncbi:MAG: WD40 repeat domain-containing protein [Planctomycetota bacterium]|nr:MAG: WD40 repeat domain-containing protein [Planctomycetota bacterium]REK32856.1 MAG: WD40 repeat domain-containing protein [Planctomycetota bacterium]
MIFDLVKDFADVLNAMPEQHSRGRILKLLDEAIRRDVHFIDRHPTTFFQCMWNTCWWYDCPDAAGHYEDLPGDTSESLPWSISGAKLSQLLEQWRTSRESQASSPIWLRCVRPPFISLGGAQRAVFRGHEDVVASIAVSPDGSRIVSGSRDKTVRIWNGLTGEEQAVLRRHQSRVTCAEFSPDGNRIASGSIDRTLRVWDANSGYELMALRGHEKGIQSVAFSPDGTLIAGGSLDQTLRVWDAATGAEVAVLDKYANPVMAMQHLSLAFSPEGRRIVVGCSHDEVHHQQDNAVRVWDIQSSHELAILHGQKNGVTSVSWSSDGRLIALGSVDDTVRVWDTTTDTELAVLRGHTSTVTSAAFSPNGKRIISGAHDGTLRMWDVETRSEILALFGHEDGVTSVAFTPSGSQIVSGSVDRTVRIWDMSGSQAVCPNDHESSIDSVAFSADGCRVASGSSDGTLRVWDVASGMEVKRWSGNWKYRGIDCLAFSRDGSQILAISSDHMALVFDATTGSMHTALGPVTASPAKRAAFTPDGQRIVVCDSCDVVSVYDLTMGVEDRTTSAAFSSDGRCVVSASRDDAVQVWDADTGRCLETRQRTGKVDEIAVGLAGPELTWRVIASDAETRVESTTDGCTAVYYPQALRLIAASPSGIAWVGCVAKHLNLLQLEGDTERFLRQ